MQRHTHKLIRGKTPQLPIIAQILGHTASKRRHRSAFEMKNRVLKTFLSLLNLVSMWAKFKTCFKAF